MVLTNMPTPHSYAIKQDSSMVVQCYWAAQVMFPAVINWLILRAYCHRLFNTHNMYSVSLMPRPHSEWNQDMRLVQYVYHLHLQI